MTDLPDNRLLAVFAPFPRFALDAPRTALVVADDVVFSKVSSSPFNSTAIDRFLRNLEIDTLLLCGVVTNGCVEGTVRDASDLGYQVVMIEDACAAVTPALHQAAITNLEDAFCNVRCTDDVLAELNGLAASVRTTKE